MKVYLWECRCEWLCQLILWDGDSTYWGDGMKPSGGYKKMRTKVCQITDSRFVYIGEL